MWPRWQGSRWAPSPRRSTAAGSCAADARARAAAAEQLGFQPNKVARSLLAGRTYTVGLITTDSSGASASRSCSAPRTRSAPGRWPPLCDSRGDPIREQHYVRTLLGRRVDGIIVTGRAPTHGAVGRTCPIPTVVYALRAVRRPGRLLGGQRRGRGRPRRRRAPARDRALAGSRTSPARAATRRRASGPRASGHARGARVEPAGGRCSARGASAGVGRPPCSSRAAPGWTRLLRRRPDRPRRGRRAAERPARARGGRARRRGQLGGPRRAAGRR